MKKPAQLVALTPLLFLGACSFLPQFNAHRPGNNAIITPMHCDQEGDRLRLAVKDNIDVAGVVTSAGSQYFATTHKPAEKDAPCLALARARNVQIIGKANLSEFAVSPSGVNEYFGTPRNPFCFWRKRIPGGSSSGSAVAVAGGFSDVALGTDTAGSIRVPAACCGVVGLKTTKGLVPIQGVHPIEPEHMDTVGPLGKDIASAIVGMDLLQEGFMEKYAKVKADHPSAGTWRVGRLKLKGTDPKIDAAIDEALTKAGFQVVQLDPSFEAKWEQAKRDGNAVAAAGAWISDKDYANKAGVSLRTKVVILTGRLNYNLKYQGALARRAAWQAALTDTFRKVDFIALPTLQNIPAPQPNKLDIGQLEAQMLSLQNTVAINYAGNPAIALPIPLHGAGFAITSLQLIGPNKSEANLLNAGHFVEVAVHKSNRGSSYDRLATACPYTETSKVLRH